MSKVGKESNRKKKERGGKKASKKRKDGKNCEETPEVRKMES